jgi:hypothetical protein
VYLKLINRPHLIRAVIGQAALDVVNGAVILVHAVRSKSNALFNMPCVSLIRKFVFERIRTKKAPSTLEVNIK